MKKLLALVLALALVFGTVSFAVAAPADVEGTDYESSVARLVGLGILKGYPDGTFKPENTITRAEFAVVVVKLLGLADAAQYAAGDTGFADVPADHWASGYVNIAVNKGVIKGYPDGTFGPNNPVSYAEAVTMLVRVLGYGPAADEEGTWPANYIAKGAELGVTEDVNFYGYAPATRGNVALMADNSLDVDLMVRVGYGDEATYQVEKGKTLLSEKLSAYSAKAVLLADKLVDNSLDENELDIVDKDVDGDGTDETTLTVADGFEYDWYAHVGEELKFWFNEDDEVFNVETSSDVVYSRITDLAPAKGDIEVVDPDDEDDVKAYDFAAGFGDANVYKNLDKSATQAQLAVDMDVKLVLNDDGEVVYVVATDWTVKIVEGVDVDDEEIEVAGTDLDLAGHEYDVDLEGIEKDDVIFYYSKDTGKDDADDNDIFKYFIVVVDEKVEGELEEVGSSSFTVDGNDIDFGALVGTYNDADALKGILGKNVTVLLDKWGDAYKVILDEDEEEAGNYGLVTDVAVETDKYGNNTAYIKLLTTAGEKVEYEVADDAVIKVAGTKVMTMEDTNADVDEGTDTITFFIDANTNGVVDSGEEKATVNENDKTAASNQDYFVVKYELDADGKLDLIDIVEFGGSAAGAVTVDEDEETVGVYDVKDTTVFFDRVNEEVISFEDFKDGSYNLFVKTDSDSAFGDLVLVVYSGGATTLAEEVDYAIYITYKTVVDGFKVKLLVNGEQTYYFASDDDISAPTQSKGDFVQVEFSDGDIVDLSGKTFTDVDLTVEEVDYDNLRMAVYDGSTTYTIKANEDTIVYDISDLDDIKEVEFGDIDDEMTVDYLENADKPGYAKVIVIK